MIIKKMFLMLLVTTAPAHAGVFKSQPVTLSVKTSAGGGSNVLPQGSTGIASKYVGDVGIAADPNVIYFDGFESYTKTSDMIGAGKWDDTSYNTQYVRIATEAGNFFAGTKSAEFSLPKTNSEVSIEVLKEASLPQQDIIFVRFYAKFATGYDTTGDGHNGIFVASNYWRGLCEATNSCGPGKPSNGKNKFLISYEARRTSNGPASPGSLSAYVYLPDQREAYGDHFYPTGIVDPFTNTPYPAFDGSYSNLATYIPFVSRPEVIPKLNQWYCYEIMVKANTPGQRDGRIALWLDGAIIADFPNLRLRDIADLKINHVGLSLHSNGGINAVSKKYYDNVVIAKSYIGPMK